MTALKRPAHHSSPQPTLSVSVPKSDVPMVKRQLRAALHDALSVIEFMIIFKSFCSCCRCCVCLSGLDIVFSGSRGSSTNVATSTSTAYHIWELLAI